MSLWRVNTNPDDDEICGLGIFWGFHKSPSAFFWILTFARAIRSIIPVTWNPEYPLPPLVFLSLCCPISCVVWENSQHFATVRHYWFPLKMTSEEQPQKFNTHDVLLPRSGWYVILIGHAAREIYFLYLSLPILCRVTATARGTHFCRPVTVPPQPMQWERSPHQGSPTLYQQGMGSLTSHRSYMCKSCKTWPTVYRIIF